MACFFSALTKFTFIPCMFVSFSKYESSGYKDELCMAAMMLYKAERMSTYIDDAKAAINTSETPPQHFDWDDKRVACAVGQMTDDVIAC